MATLQEVIHSWLSGGSQHVNPTVVMNAGDIEIGAVELKDGASDQRVSISAEGALSVSESSLVGPGAPVVDSYANAVIDLAASTANQQIIAAPGANKQIWVYGFALLCDTAAGTVTFQDSDDTAITGTMAISDEGGISSPPSGNFAMPIWKLATNKALEADTGACTVDGWICFAIISL